MELKDYKNVFVFAEQREGVIQSVAFELLGKARDLADTLGEKVVAMLLGCGIQDQAQSLIEMGADEVITDYRSGTYECRFTVINHGDSYQDVVHKKKQFISNIMENLELEEFVDKSPDMI